MFCGNCGAQQPDGSVFCSNCGCQLTIPQRQPACHTAATPEKKSVFLQEIASDGTKRNSRIVLITSLLCILLLVLSAVFFLTRSFFRIPMVSTILNLSGMAYDVADAMTELEDSVESAEDKYDRNEDAYSSKEQEAFEKLLAVMKKTVRKPSILNFRKVVHVFADVAVDMSDSVSDSDLYEIQMIRKALDVIILAILGSILLPALFFLLGGLTKSMGWNIAALVLSLLPGMILGGTLMTLALLAAGIVSIVFCGKINREYDRYCSGCAYGY